MTEDTLTDFALAAFREDGRWEVAPLPPRVGDGLTSLVATLRQLPAEGGALGLVSVSDDFAVLARVTGTDVRVLLSDVTAAAEVPFAAEVLEAAGEGGGEDLETVRPAGDLEIVADLGLDAMEMAAICDDIDLYPDELLGRIAGRLGFGEEFDRAVDVATH